MEIPRNPDQKKYHRVGDIEYNYDHGDIVEAAARAAHEANRAYCIAIGDHTQVSWDHAPEWQRKSSREGVEGVIDGNGPEQCHASWLVAKADAGWKYGPIKDVEKKEHPCFVPYADLPAAQKRKDDVYVAVVRAVVRALRGTLVDTGSFELSLDIK